VNLAKHALYEYGDYGDYYSRYNSYYGANPGQRSGPGGKPDNGQVAPRRESGGGTTIRPRPVASEDESGIAKLKRIVPRMK
jgi:hypothetical protein